MSAIHLLRIGEVEDRLLTGLRKHLADELRMACEVLPVTVDPAFAFHIERQQHHSTEILARMPSYARDDCWRLLGVTGVDLYIPILTFVFGEAEVGGNCAVVSSHRLTEEFYGLPPDPGLLGQRLLKEAVHELGHTLGLSHCEDYACAMAPSHAVEWIDLKGVAWCGDCRARIAAARLSD